MDIYKLIELQNTWVSMIEENLSYYPEEVDFWRNAKLKDVKDFFVAEGWNHYEDCSLGDCVFVNGSDPIKLSDLKKFLKSDGRNIDEFLSQCVNIAVDEFLSELDE